MYDPSDCDIVGSFRDNSVQAGKHFTEGSSKEKGIQDYSTRLGEKGIIHFLQKRITGLYVNYGNLYTYK